MLKPKYTISSSRVIRNDGNGKVLQNALVIIDTENDILTAEEIEKEGLVTGSTLWIADKHELKILNNAKEWI